MVQGSGHGKKRQDSSGQKACLKCIFFAYTESGCVCPELGGSTSRPFLSGLPFVGFLPYTASQSVYQSFFPVSTCRAARLTHLNALHQQCHILTGFKHSTKVKVYIQLVRSRVASHLGLQLFCARVDKPWHQRCPLYFFIFLCILRECLCKHKYNF